MKPMHLRFEANNTHKAWQKLANLVSLEVSTAVGGIINIANILGRPSTNDEEFAQFSRIARSVNEKVFQAKVEKRDDTTIQLLGADAVFCFENLMKLQESTPPGPIQQGYVSRANELLTSATSETVLEPDYDALSPEYAHVRVERNPNQR